jgi:hypothetical protein
MRKMRIIQGDWNKKNEKDTRGFGMRKMRRIQRGDWG